MVATGHYCRKDILTDGQGNAVKGENGEPIYRIFEGTDPGKDQSYFLCSLSQAQLSKALFPIGHLLKSEVRAIAKDAGLMSAEKKDSQGICFIGKVDLPTFLKQKLTSKEGDIVEVFDDYFNDNPQYSFIRETLSGLTPDGSQANLITSYISEDKAGTAARAAAFDEKKIALLSDETLLRLSRPMEYDIRFETETYRSGKKHTKKTRYKENPSGKIIGRHEGCQFYTIGQRKGLDVGGHKNPVFIIATDVEKNIIYVGEGHTHKGLSRSCLRIAPEEIHMIRPDLAMSCGEIRRFDIRIRYRQPLQSGWAVMRENGLFILFDCPQRGITPGQFAVLYKDGEMVASGVIDR